MKLTPWYPSHIKPARPGVYMVYSSSIDLFQHWNGRFWGLLENTPKAAARCASRNSHISPLPTWRGLAKEPK